MILAFLLLIWLSVFVWIDRHLNFSSPSFSSSSSMAGTSITMVIVFRNEEEHLPSLIESIKASVADHVDLELLFIDDHSTDESVRILETYASQLSAGSRLAIHSNPGSGKKEGLLYALSLVHTDWVFFTDADCVLPNHLITRLWQHALACERPVAFAPVSYISSSQNGWYTLENVNTQAVTEAFLATGKPMMVNGANMLIAKSMLPRFIQSQRLEYPGGDDVFFAQSLDASEYTFLYFPEVTVKTFPPDNLRSALYQRLRWISKGRAYREWAHILFTALVGVVSLASVLLFIFWLSFSRQLDTIIGFLVIKWIIEFGFHYRWGRKQGTRVTLLPHLFMSILYPFYSVWLALLSFLPLSYEWKARSYSTRPNTMPH